MLDIVSNRNIPRSGINCNQVFVDAIRKEKSKREEEKATTCVGARGCRFFVFSVISAKLR